MLSFYFQFIHIAKINNYDNNNKISRYLKQLLNKRLAVFPENLLLGDIPTFPFVVIPLEKEVGPAIGVGENVGMTRFTLVPFTRLPVWQERLAK
jgi:hypothetical protein